MFGKRSDQPRTSEDRARAAAERAARRAGRPLPPEAFADAVPPPDAEPRVERPPEPEAEPPRPEPPEERPDADVPRDETPPPAATTRADVPRPDAPRDETPGAEMPRPETPRDDALHQPTVEYTPFQTEEHEAPLGQPRDGEPRLVAARGRVQRDGDEQIHAYARAPRADTAEEDGFDETDERPALPPLRRAPARAAAAQRRRPAPSAPRRRPPAPQRSGDGGAHWGLRIFAVVALVVIAGALYVVNGTFQPFHGEGEGTVEVRIPEGADAGRIGTILADAGVVDSARFFELNATISGERGELRPGRYTLKRGMTNAAAIDALQVVPKAPKPVETVDVRLLEGPSRKENAPVVDDSNKVEGGYARASSRKSVLRRIRDLGAPKGTKTAEGFLFPATYTLPVGSTANRLVNEQLDTFEENFKQVDIRKAKRGNLTRYDVVIIASMIEREAQLARERRLVSAVIYNRLKQGMPLGIDATIRYATNNWQRPIRVSELEKPGPYNTRLNTGLPPTPIGNPGLASLKAAANPANKDYLFYVRKPGKSGEHAFSSTDEQFQRDVARYQRSREGR